MDTGKRIWKYIGLLFLSGILIFTAVRIARFEGKGENKYGKLGQECKRLIEEKILDTHLPVFSYAGRTDTPKGWNLFFMPKEDYLITQSDHEIDQLILKEGQDEDTEEEPDLTMPQEGEGILQLSPDIAEKLYEENHGTEEKEQQEFAKTQTKQQEYQWNYYTDTEKLIKDFYAVDATTKVREGQLDVKKLLEMDMKLTHDNSTPQILIYHTHSQEGFADSIPGDESTTIMGAGERLSEILRTEYGFNVLHHTGKYDVETRDYAYSYALAEMEKVLEENPQIEVVIDLHRDAVKEGGSKLVTEIDGRPTAQFMFFNGLSYTKKQGDIAYLNNPYIEENLAFSFQMQVLCNEYYPGVTRRIYLKGYRYNMHLRPKTLLIELGAQNNTVEEVNNALDIIAHVLAMELNGEKID